MGLWDSFKKKVEDQWEVSDFWDKKENAQQVAARQPQIQAPTALQPGALRVETRQPTQQLTIAQPQTQSQPLQVTTPKPLELQLPDGRMASQIPKTPTQLVDMGLDAGKSWEQIAQENQLDLNEVVKYSQSTRPNYGISMQKPQQSFWNKGRDLIDANTEADKYRRYQANQRPENVNKQELVTTVNPGNIVSNTVGAIPRMFNTAGNQIVEVGYTAQQQFATQELTAATQAVQQAQQLNDPIALAVAKERWNKASQRVQDINNMIGIVKEGYGDGGGLFNAGTMYNEEDSYAGGMQGAKKIVGNTVEGAADIVSLGMASIPKGIVKQGGKQIVKKVAPVAAVNFTGNAANTLGQGGDAGQAVVSGTAGAVLGTGGDFAGRAIVRGAGKGKNKIVDMINGGEDLKVAPSVYQKVNPATGEKIYKVIDEADFDSAKADVDGKFAGTPQEDGFTPHLTAKTPAEMEALGFKNAGKYTPDVDGVNKPLTPAQVAQPAGVIPKKTQQVAELLNMDRYTKKTTENIDDVLSKQYGVDASTVRRLRNGYGDEQARNILARSSDATNIRDMNAFVISEARKAYGSPQVRVQRPVKASDTPVEEVMEKIAKKVDEVEAPKPELKPNTNSKLGSIVESFYEARKGKNEKIGFRALQDLGQKVSRQVDDDLAAIGSDFSDVARRIQEGARNGVRTLDEAGLTADEASIIRKAQSEMNYIRRRASLGTKQVKDGDFGEVYLPQQKKGQYGGEKLFEGFRDTQPGSELTRKNKIELEDLDYAPTTIGQYITRYGDTRAYKQQRIYNALKRANPELDDDVLNKGAEQISKIQDKVNSLKTKIGAYGFGSRKTLSAGEYVDTAAQLSDVGKTLGKTQVDVTGVPKGLTNGDKINSVMIGDTPLADFVGLNQYRDAGNFGNKQVIDAAGDRAELARMVEQRLLKDYNLGDEELEYIVGGISRIANDVPEEVVKARVVSTYRMAAKQQMMEQLQNVNIKNAKLRRAVSDLSNQILREGTIEQELSQKVVSKVLTTTNAIFRKLNVSSAMNELGDLPSFLSSFKGHATLVPDFKGIKEFGLGDIDAAIEPYIKQVQQGKSLKSVLGSINSSTNLYKFVETYKAGVVVNSAKKLHMANGLEGDDLVKAVLNDYRSLALPVDAFTKTALDNFPLYTQYMTWGVRNLQKEGKLATGKLAAGSLKDMDKMERIFRNAYANIPAKTAWWLTSNGLKGTAILTAFGLTDFTGMSSQDFSGISEEDKSWFDRTTKYTNMSTVMSLTNNIIQSLEKEQLKDKYADASYNPYENERADKDIMKLFTPQFYKNAAGAEEMMEQGYSENDAGRIQYEAPTDMFNTMKAYVFGKGNTENAREYSGRKNIQDRIAGGDNPFVAVADMAKEQLGIQDTDYNRPITDKYTEAYKDADQKGRTALLQGGRAYNSFLDDMRDNSPDDYERYISALDGNHVNPEYWKTITGDTSKPDLAVFNMIKSRKQQQAKDLGTAYDPIYDLPDDQAKAVLQQKATATGDDIALRNSLYKEQWYNDYMDKVSEYYRNKPESVDSEYDQTERVVQWYDINDQFNGMKKLTEEDGSRPAWSQEFPTVYANKVILDQYGFDSDQAKNFFRAYGDQYKAEKAVYDEQQLALINQMREIEGYPSMSAAQYAQVKAIEDTDGDDSSGGGYSRGSGTSTAGLKNASFGQRKALELPSAKIKVAKVKINRSQTPKTVKIKRNKKYA